MKKIMVFALVTVVLVLAAGVSLGQEKRQKASKNQSPDEIAWQEKLAAMTPEQQQVAKAQRAFETTVAPWREIRKIAQGEKATKTVAAIDKLIAAEEVQLKQRLAKMGKGTPGGQPDQKADRKGKGKKKAEGN